MFLVETLHNHAESGPVGVKFLLTGYHFNTIFQCAGLCSRRPLLREHKMTPNQKWLLFPNYHVTFNFTFPPLVLLGLGAKTVRLGLEEYLLIWVKYTF